MPGIPVGQPAPSGGGGIAGIPTKYLIIGGGAVAMAFFFLNKKGSTAAPVDPNAPAYGNALGPNAALALGDLQTRVLQQSGEIQKQMQGYFAGLGDSISGLSNHLDTQAAALSDSQTAQGQSWFQALFANLMETRTEIGAAGNPGDAQQYRDAYNSWISQFLGSDPSNTTLPIAAPTVAAPGYGGNPATY